MPPVTDDDDVAAGNVDPKFVDKLVNVLNVVPIFAVPVIDDGLNVCGVLNGLRECGAGSGLKAIRVESVNTNAINYAHENGTI